MRTNSFATAAPVEGFTGAVSAIAAVDPGLR